MTTVLEKLESLHKKIESGKASIEETHEFRYLTCQQMIISLGVNGTEGLTKLPQSHVLACVDAMSTLLFLGEWDSNPSLIALSSEEPKGDEDTEDAKLIEGGEDE